MIEQGKMSKLENVSNTIIPYMIKSIVLVGIIVVLISMTIAVYYYLKKKQASKEIKTYLCYAFCTGIMISLSGILVNFIANFDINFSSYKHSVPIGYIILLVIYLLFSKIVNQKNEISRERYKTSIKKKEGR